MNCNRRLILLCTYAIIGMIFLASFTLANDDVEKFLRNFEGGVDMNVKTGHISNFVIERPQIQVTFVDGEATIFDFGLGKPSAIAFNGTGQISYVPPNHIEAFQLARITGKDQIADKFDNAIVFFTSGDEFLGELPEISLENFGEGSREILSDAYNDAFKNLKKFLPNDLLDGLLSSETSEYLYIDLRTDKNGHLAIEQNANNDDLYTIYQLKRYGGNRTLDILAGYSPDDLLVSERGVQPIDITHYDINVNIDADGDMSAKCRIYYSPLISGKKFLYFNWFSDTDIISIVDDSGNSLYPVFRKEGFKLIDLDVEEPGVGLVLSKPTVKGDSNYIDFEYKGEFLRKFSTIFYVRVTSSWYPSMQYRDLATFDLTFNTPDKYEVITCGHCDGVKEENGRRISHHVLDIPAEYVSFNVGSFRSKEITAEGYPPVEIYLTEEIADVSGGGEVVTVKDRLGNAGADIMNSLAFYSSMIGQCPFDTLKVTSIPYSHGQGSPGLVYLSMNTFLDEDLDGYHEAFRAHEVAHQWWGHAIDIESYRDTWIIEGLSEYCGLWFYQMSGKNKKAYEKMLKEYRSWIKSGIGTGSKGLAAGPPVMGYRLSSTDSDDETSQMYYKGAYIFHMIRYILYDYKSESDSRFVAFLNDLLATFKDKPITTERMKAVLEKHCSGDMTWFFNQWVYGNYMPRYKFDSDVQKVDGGKTQVTVSIKQSDVPDGFKMLVPVTIVFDEGRYVHYKIWVDKPEVEMTFPAMPYKTKDVVFNTYDAVLCDR